MGGATASIQGTLFGVTGSIGPEFTAWLSSGNGLIGVAICLLRMATKGLPGHKRSVEIFFGISAVLCVVCMAVNQYVKTAVRGGDGKRV